MNELEKDILKVINNRPYVRLGNETSVTELIQPMRIIHLKNRHANKIVKDSLDNMLPSIIGTAVHDVVQRYLTIHSNTSNKYWCERRLLHVVNGVRVAGRFDIINLFKKELIDVKVVRVWKYLFGGKDEWEKQLNIYKLMLYHDKIFLNKLKVMMILLDWERNKTFHNSSYPKRRINYLNIKEWPLQQTEEFLKERVDAWLNTVQVPDDKLPKCTAEERWASPPVYKLYRTKTQKTSSKNFDNLQSAKRYLDVCKTNDKAKWTDGQIKEYKAEPFKRCETWCEAAPFCNQFKNKEI